MKKPRKLPTILNVIIQVLIGILIIVMICSVFVLPRDLIWISVILAVVIGLIIIAYLYALFFRHKELIKNPIYNRTLDKNTLLEELGLESHSRGRDLYCPVGESHSQGGDYYSQVCEPHTNGRETRREGRKPTKRLKARFVIVMLLFLLIPFTCLFAALYKGPTKINDVSYTISFNGDGAYIVLTIEYTGDSPYLFYTSYYNTTKADSESLISARIPFIDREIEKRIGPFKRGTEIWIIIATDQENKFQVWEETIRIEREPASTSDNGLSLDQIDYTPRALDLRDENPIRVYIDGTNNRTEAVVYCYYIFKSSLFNARPIQESYGRKMILDNNTYTAIIDTDSTSSSIADDPDATLYGTLLFRVVCYDESRTVASQTYTIQMMDE